MNQRWPAWLMAAAAIAGVIAVGCMDWLTGYELDFFVFYFIPVSVGAWFVGLGFSVVLSVFSALVWYAADMLAGHVYSTSANAVWNTIVLLAGLLAMGWFVSRMRLAHEGERNAAAALRQALSEVKVLEAVLPICAQCKKIRNEQGEWQRLESYMGQHTNSQFSHGYCPECARKVLEEAGLADERPGQ